MNVLAGCACSRPGSATARGLVSDVAHELRTPLTIIDGQLAGVEDGVYALDSDLIASLREEIDPAAPASTEDLSGLSASAEESACRLRRAQTDLAALAVRT